MDIEWDREREWPRRHLRPLLQRIIADWREERVSIGMTLWKSTILKPR